MTREEIESLKDADMKREGIIPFGETWIFHKLMSSPIKTNEEGEWMYDNMFSRLPLFPLKTNYTFGESDIYEDLMEHFKE